MSAPAPSGFGPSHILVGALNLLGDAYNPFEFLPLSDAELMKHHGVLKAKFQELRWSEVEEASRALFKDFLPKASIEEALDRLRNHCQSRSLFLYFDKEALKNDNKFIENRTNLLTMALMPCGNGTQCDMLVPGDPWIDILRNQAVSDAPDAAYSVDPNLFLWDLVCNVVATFCKAAYEEICRCSSLNPVNYEAVGNRFFAEVDAHNSRCLPVVLGFEEFPTEGTVRGRVYESVLEKRNYQLARGPGSTAIAYRGFANDARVLNIAPSAHGHKQTLGCIDPEALMRSCIDAAAQDGIELSEVEKNGFMKTTARKTLALQLASIAFMVVHVKEPKTSAAATVLARYIRSLGDAASSQYLTDGMAKCKSWVLMTDSNLASAKLADDFKAALTAESLGPAVALVPDPCMMTTSKHRSLIHGQCYDKAKCEKTVVAPKDYIIASQIGTLQECRVAPSIENCSATSLPTRDWGSDHCLVTAVYSPLGKMGSRVLEAFRELDKTGTGEMYEEDLRTLFRCLGRIILSKEDIDAMLEESGAWLGRGADSDIVQCALRYPANIDQHTVGSAVEDAARNGLIREVPDSGSIPVAFRMRLLRAACIAIESGHLEAGALILQDLPGLGIELVEPAEKLCRSAQVGTRAIGVELWNTCCKNLTEAQRSAVFARFVTSFFAAASRDIHEDLEDEMQALRDSFWDVAFNWQMKKHQFTLVEGALSELDRSLQDAGDWVRAEAAMWTLAKYARSRRADVAKSMDVCLLVLKRLAAVPGLSALIVSACVLIEVMPAVAALPVVLDRRLTDRALRGHEQSKVVAAVASAATACCAVGSSELWEKGTAPVLVEELQSRALAGEEGLVAAAAELLASKDVRPLARQWAQLCTQASSDVIASRAKAFLSTIVNLDVCSGLWVDCVSMLCYVPGEARVDFMSRVAGFIVGSAGRWRSGGAEPEILSNASHLWVGIWAQAEGDLEMIESLGKLVQASARTTSSAAVAMEALIRSFDRASAWSPQVVDAAISVLEASVAPAGSVWPLTRAIVSSYGHVLAVACRLAERQPVSSALRFIGALASWREDSEDGVAIRGVLHAQSSAVRSLLERGEDRRLVQRIGVALGI